jgi:hypothetical protein
MVLLTPVCIRAGGRIGHIIVVLASSLAPMAMGACGLGELAKFIPAWQEF